MEHTLENCAASDVGNDEKNEDCENYKGRQSVHISSG